MSAVDYFHAGPHDDLAVAAPPAAAREGGGLATRLGRFLATLAAHMPRGLTSELEGSRPVGPIFCISQVQPDLWVVTRRGDDAEGAFAELGEAVAYVREEAGRSPATVELRIGDLYAVAYLDPARPRPFLVG